MPVRLLCKHGIDGATPIKNPSRLLATGEAMGRRQKGDRVATTLPLSILIPRSSQRAAISWALPSSRST